MRTTVLLITLSALVSPGLSQQPVALEVDHERSSIVVRTFKAGFLSFAFGHEHGILATDWEADICFNENTLEDSRLRLTIPVRSLVIDSPEAMRKADLDPEDRPGAEDIKELQQNMMGPENLSAQEYPEITFRTTSITRREPGVIALEGPLTIRGQAHVISFPVQISSTGNEWRFQGEAAVRQTDYGISPATVAGVVKVEDEVSIRFDIYASKSDSACLSEQQ